MENTENARQVNRRRRHKGDSNLQPKNQDNNVGKNSNSQPRSPKLAAAPREKIPTCNHFNALAELGEDNASHGEVLERIRTVPQCDENGKGNRQGEGSTTEERDDFIGQKVLLNSIASTHLTSGGIVNAEVSTGQLGKNTTPRVDVQSSLVERDTQSQAPSGGSVPVLNVDSTGTGKKRMEVRNFLVNETSPSAIRPGVSQMDTIKIMNAKKGKEDQASILPCISNKLAHLMLFANMEVVKGKK